MAAGYLTDGEHDDKQKGCKKYWVPWDGIVVDIRATRSEGKRHRG